MKADSRKLGLLLEEIEQRYDEDRNQLVRYVDKLNDEMNKLSEYNKYLAEQLNEALVRIAKLESK